MKSNLKIPRLLKSPLYAEAIIGEHPSIREIYSKIQKVAPSAASVLISGETGTGKGLIAREIHNQSNRKNNPFLTLHCVGLSEQLIESELFGYVKGAFTGAKEDKKGLFEATTEGTLFLDDIENIPLLTQAKLLQALGDKEIRKVGDTKIIEINTRIITATNKPLQKLVAQKEFREDLYYRLNIGFIKVPPLRERKSDIPLLVKHFLDKYKINKTITPDAMSCLLDYDFPGNVRELENIIQKAYINSDSLEIQEKDIQDAINESRLDLERGSEKEAAFKFVSEMGFEQFKKEYISHFLDNSKTIAEASRKSGIPESTLSDRRKELSAKKVKAG